MVIEFLLFPWISHFKVFITSFLSVDGHIHIVGMLVLFISDTYCFCVYIVLVKT